VARNRDSGMVTTGQRTTVLMAVGHKKVCPWCKGRCCSGRRGGKLVPRTECDGSCDGSARRSDGEGAEQ
jgi:hypothetical protein